MKFILRPKTKNTIYTLFILLIIGFGFQNCGPGLESMSGSLEESSIDMNDTYEDESLNFKALSPGSSATTSKVTKNYTLPNQVVPKFAASMLDWEFNENNPAFINAITALGSTCEQRRLDFIKIPNKFSPIIYDEGLLPGDPLIEKMRNAKSAIEQNLNIAFCAYVAPTTTLRDVALKTSLDFIMTWNKTYVGDGNPINERFFINLFIAADLLFPKMNKTQITSIRNLAARMEKKERSFMATLRPTDGRLKNNWMTRHLMILTFANIILDNKTRLNQLKSTLNADVNRQYSAPANFTLSTCANLRNIGAYGSYDLQERDAFLYHMSGIAELAPLTSLYPSFLNTNSKNKLLTAINLTKPYVLGQKNHPEFKCSKVAYDIQKLKLQPSLGDNWNPHNYRTVYRYARLQWPETKAWTSRFLTTDYSAWFKVIVTGKGDVL